jgi:hypothetical protein
MIGTNNFEWKFASREQPKGKVYNIQFSHTLESFAKII